MAAQGGGTLSQSPGKVAQEPSQPADEGFTDEDTGLIPESESSGQGSDTDSALGSASILSSTQSLRESLLEGIEENGRRYHKYKEGKYFLPNDEQEQDRLDLQHAMFLHMLHGDLYFSPLDTDRLNHVLDIGTGTGIWAIDFADTHPNAQVTGTDLSVIQPLYVPPNCSFQIHDAEDDWDFSYQFSYIHGRALVTCFRDPREVIRKAYESLEPGGYLEFQDGSMPMHFHTPPPPGSPIVEWVNNIMEASTIAGRKWTNVQNYKRWMIEQGFEDVHEKKIHIPINPWAKGEYMKKLALFFHTDLMEGIEGMSMKLFTNILKWTPEQVQLFLVGVRNDLRNKHIRGYITAYFVWGRKPQTPM